jgi:phosphoketolase
MTQTKSATALRQADWVDHYCEKHPAAERWAVGYEEISHNLETQARIFLLAEQITSDGSASDDGVGISRDAFFDLLSALDRVASAAMWLVVHEVYACNVYMDGRGLAPEDFKQKPEGHTGGSLNMVPAYAGYLAANAIARRTRSWIMGQGHCVAAIDSLNLLVDNMLPAHAERYSLTDEGLSRYVQDFYSYKLTTQGQQDSPLGSHVNPHTAGGMAEGGYLGFVQLQYMHMPLPGESLVTFLSDGAFEEQRGSDWAPRWWRQKDCGDILPIMINNGRRIDQRSTMAQKGGTDWLVRHLELNSFDPIVIDGTDPAAFVWLIFEMEQRLQAAGTAVEQGEDRYPVAIPYGIAVAQKGAGFVNAGTNLAHDLPLDVSPREDMEMVKLFNQWARKLWVPPQEIREAITRLQTHEKDGRPKERDHAITDRHVDIKEVATPDYQAIPDDRTQQDSWSYLKPMAAVDDMFTATVQANPHLRPRVGNPDEMRSNRLKKTLQHLKFRVTDPEDDLPEDVYGAVITALNEEAVCSAALGNKGGINLVDTYEAFGAKMHGVMRQEIIFAKHQKSLGQSLHWLSIPLILTSHTWENGKNEQSHQDPMMAEAMLNEPSDISRVLFPPDYNATAFAMQQVYQTHGQFWSMVVAKRDKIPNLFTPAEAERLYKQGAMRLEWAGHRVEEQQLVLTAIGSYQLLEILKASARLTERDIPHSVVYILEPGRFRMPRDAGEMEHIASGQLVEELYPPSVPARVFITHTRPEPMFGTLFPLLNNCNHAAILGFINQGGTLEHKGMLFINRSTWGHALLEAARVMDIPRDQVLTQAEQAALMGQRNPQGVIV